MNSSYFSHTKQKSSIITFVIQFCVLSIIAIILQNNSLAELPEATNKYINDFAEVIDDNNKAKITARLQNLDTEEDIEMTIVTIDSIEDYDTSNIKEFSRRLFNDWGVGKLPENKGIMMIVAIDDRKVRVQMGNGYENKYDGAMKSIINKDLAPAFRSQSYGDGIYQGTVSIIDEISSPFAGFGNLFGWAWKVFIGISVIILAIFAMFSSRNDNTREDYSDYNHDLDVFDNNDSDSFFGGGDSSDGGADGDW